MADGRPSRTATAAFGILVVASGLVLRYPITSVSAALGDVTEHYRLSAGEAAVLTTLPVLMLALGAPLAPVLERRLGVERAILALAAVLSLSVGARAVDTAALFVGTVVSGAAIAGLGVLIPQVIRIRLPGRVGLWSGIFTTSFGVSAAVGAALTLPLVDATGSLPEGLALWMVPALGLTAAAWAVCRRVPAPSHAHRAAATRSRRRPRSPILLGLSVFFGCQALVFFAVTTWLPTIFVDRGLDAPSAARLLAWMSVAGLPASLLMPVVAASLRRQHVPVLIVSVGSAVGLTGMLWAPTALAPVFVAVLGAAQAAAFGLAVTLIVLKAPHDRPVAPFSATAQGFGYAIAAVGPLALGLLRSVHVSWSVASILLFVAIVLQVAAGWPVARHVLPESAEPVLHGAPATGIPSVGPVDADG